MRVVILLAVLIPSAIALAYVATRPLVARRLERDRHAATMKEIAQIEAENLRLDELLERDRIRDGVRATGPTGAIKAPGATAADLDPDRWRR